MTAITTAARLLREAAAELKNAHTLGGDWGNELEALDAYNEHMATATTLEYMGRQCLAQIEEPAADPFQARVQPWLLACFGAEIAADRAERNHRFLEESLELVQACGCSASEAHQLVDYVFGRPVGEPAQEAGGVMVTLAALCLANGLDMHKAGEVELQRIWGKVEQIRAKQAAKPKHSPLPAAPAAPSASEVVTGALFDFLGYLTTLPKASAVTFSSSHEAAPAVEHLRAWAGKRNLQLEPADVSGWHHRLAAPAAPAVDAREPMEPQHPQGMTSVNARLSFNHGWTAAERAHGIRPAAQAKEGGA